MSGRMAVVLDPVKQYIIAPAPDDGRWHLYRVRPDKDGVSVVTFLTEVPPEILAAVAACDDGRIDG